MPMSNFVFIISSMLTSCIMFSLNSSGLKSVHLFNVDIMHRGLPYSSGLLSVHLFNVDIMHHGLSNSFGSMSVSCMQSFEEACFSLVLYQTSWISNPNPANQLEYLFDQRYDVNLIIDSTFFRNLPLIDIMSVLPFGFVRR